MGEETRVGVYNRGGGTSVAIQNIFLEQHKLFQESLFVDVDLTPFAPPRFESPAPARRLVLNLLRVPLLVLGGHALEDKRTLALHLAWLLQQELTKNLAESGKEGDTAAVREWLRDSSPQKLRAAFGEHEAPTIFLLPDLEPAHVGHDLYPLWETLVSRGHYAIATTEIELSHWQAEGETRKMVFWHQPSPGEIYDESYLTHCLLRELHSAKEHLPALLTGRLDALEASSDLVAGLSVGRAAMALKTPRRIQPFVLELVALGDISDAAGLARQVERVLDRLGGDEVALARWYRRLDLRHQLLALAMALFDGLFDDQLFAVLERLVRSAWRDQEIGLRHFDYGDLKGLGAYFSVGDAGAGTIRVETSEAHRKVLLAQAWQIHRRRIVALLPQLVELARRSAQADIAMSGEPQPVAAAETTATKKEAPRRGPAAPEAPAPVEKDALPLLHGAEREIFGSPQRVNQIREAISSGLAELGFLSTDAVEATLLELASHDDPEVQSLAAVAMARWRDGGPQERRLFEISRRWLSEALIQERVRTLADRLGAALHGGIHLANIRASVALIVGNALLRDRFNEMPPELCEIVERLIDEPDPEVRRRFRDSTLPLALSRHLEQLEPLARGHMLEHQDLLVPIAQGIAGHYAYRPHAALAVLDTWQRECGAAMVSQFDSPTDPSPRDRKLAVVILALGMLGEDPGGGPITPKEIFDRLGLFLARERSPFVRWAVYYAMVFQAFHHLPRIEPLLQDLVDEVPLDERRFLVSTLANLYLKQRKALRGGDDLVFAEGELYTVWRDASQRPRTEMERIMDRWLKDHPHPAAQQVAVQVFHELGTTALERRERHLGARKTATPRIPHAFANRGSRLHRLPLAGRVCVFLATLRAPRLRAVLRAPLAEVLSWKQSADGRRLLLWRWQALGDPSQRDIAHRLSAALGLYGWRWLAEALLLGLLIALVVAYL